MKLMDFLRKNSNSFGHLVMSVFGLLFLGILVFIRPDLTTITASITLAGMVFGYWFGAQSTAIKHMDSAEEKVAAAKIAADLVKAQADTAAHPLAVPIVPVEVEQPTQKLQKVTLVKP